MKKIFIHRMNTSENRSSHVLSLSPHELTKRLDYLKKLGDDCRTIVAAMTLPDERKKYIQMLLEKKIVFANNLS
jgi:hypothetical protein